tara:strand:- start:38 stop:682 length:645 start_codon:yes stop_codon:yes gene_type:complete
MDQDIEIINKETRKEKIKNILINNKIKIIASLTSLILILFIFFFYQTYQSNQKKSLADNFNSSVIEFENGKKSKVLSSMKEIIYKKDKTYSPLALYFLIDNNLISSNGEINEYFDVIINDTNLDLEIKNLVIYKKGLFNSNFASESDLLNMLKPVTNSESIWKGHALYLLGEYFYSKDELNKSKEFFEQIVVLENVNSNIRIEAQKRIQRDFSE